MLGGLWLTVIADHAGLDGQRQAEQRHEASFLWSSGAWGSSRAEAQQVEAGFAE